MIFLGLDAALICMLIAMGLAGGFLAGLLGIGGGMILVPFLVYILGHQGVAAELAIKMAIATAMATILFTSLSSIRAHHSHGAVRWEIARGLAPGIIVGGLVAGAGAFAFIKGQALGLFFSAFVGYSAWKMYRGRGKQVSSRSSVHGFWGLGAVGSAIGFLSGLVGAGGAFLSVPYMTRCGVSMHQAVATSAALGFPIAVANLSGYVVSGAGLEQALPGSWGYFYLPAVVVIVLCSVMTAPLGAKLAHRLDVAALKRLFSLLLGALATYMLYKSLWATAEG